MMGEGLIAKLAGVIAGALLALVLLPPRSVTGFIRRIFSALVFGWIFGPILLDYMAWPEVREKVIAAHSIAAFSSWWLMGAGKKLAEKVGSKEL